MTEEDAARSTGCYEPEPSTDRSFEILALVFWAAVAVLGIGAMTLLLWGI